MFNTEIHSLFCCQEDKSFSLTGVSPKAMLSTSLCTWGKFLVWALKHSILNSTLTLHRELDVEIFCPRRFSVFSPPSLLDQCHSDSYSFYHLSFFKRFQNLITFVFKFHNILWVGPLFIPFSEQLACPFEMKIYVFKFGKFSCIISFIISFP